MRARPHDSGRFDCPQCEGRAVPLTDVLDRLPAHQSEDFERKASRRSHPPGRTRCPQCLAKTAQLVLGDTDQALRLDSCAKCALVWLDKGEWQQLTRDLRPPPSAEESRRMQARLLVEGERAKAEARGTSAGPDSAGANAIGVLGLPATSDPPTVLGPALVTILLCIALFTLWGVLDRGLASQLAFRPSDPLQLGGLTIVCSAFAHIRVTHALFNAYFLFLFGRPVEKSAGAASLALLFVAGHLLSVLAHWLAHAGQHVGLVGASGGGSAVLMFHALALRGTRVQLYMSAARRWVTMPAGMALVMWLLVQLAGTCVEASGEGRVAHFAHLGGALAGLVGWGLMHGWRVAARE